MLATLRRNAAQRGKGLLTAMALAALFALPAIVMAAPPGQPILPIEQELVNLVNEERARVNQPPLIVNYSLMEAAYVHNEHMAKIRQLCHQGCGNGTPAQRIAATGYQAATWGENVAYGSATAAGVMNQWMSSSGHRANILRGSFTDIGVAYNPQRYWTQVFSRPRSGYVTVTPPTGSGGDVPEPTPTSVCTVPMDFDGDNAVTMADVEIIRGAFMATEGDPRWQPEFDVVPNGVVDLFDIFEVILAVGTSGCGA